MSEVESGHPPAAAAAATTPLSSSSNSAPTHPALPRLITNQKRSILPRPPSQVKRVSTTSTVSHHGQSRPPSHFVPGFESSLTYTLVRDFAYSTRHHLHYGPAPEPSEPGSIVSTPVSESHRRLSDPARASWGTSLGGWSAGPWGGDGSVGGGGEQHHPSILLQGGPPYTEDGDLQSPVVITRHKRYKSTMPALGAGGGQSRGRGRERREGQGEEPVISQHYDGERGYYAGTREDGSETYYVSEADGTADGPGGEYVTYPPEQARHSKLGPYSSTARGQRDSHFAVTLPNRSYVDQPADQHQQHHYHDATSERSEPGSSPDAYADDDIDDDQARYSRNYQFTITSPDEEMHGKAVALFDFARENENELPLVEGQVIWVSYRHGQGWLVAEDPRTNESGLVPEEYVRLLRDIRGGWGEGEGEGDDLDGSPEDVDSPTTTTTTTTTTAGGDVIDDPHATPTQTDHQHHFTSLPTQPNLTNGQPKISTFSTSSKDLDPYPHHLLGTQPGQSPPPVSGRRQAGGHASTSSNPMMRTTNDDDDDDDDDGALLPARRKSSTAIVGNGNR
ncbi:MAG: HOG (high osmolarity glycerol) pathway protein [Peltula sp. TS41687]|nr:MAG: HOG (high osmolarity glycerol) pathway protein [Peltula sp. TS41687]